MKNTLAQILFYMALSGLVCVAAHAAEPGKVYDLEMGTWFSHITYKEPGVMTEDGPFIGVRATGAYRGPLGDRLPDSVLRAEVRAGLGQVRYDGRLEDGTPYSYSPIDDLLVEGRALAGYDFEIRGEVLLMPYAGVGYRYLNDHLEQAPAGYERASSYLYAPLGMEVLSQPNETGWRIGVNLEYDIFCRGEQESYYAPVIRNHQDAGYGVRGSVRLIREGRSVVLLLEPYAVYWNIEQSDLAYDNYYEPANSSIELGLHGGIRF